MSLLRVQPIRPSRRKDPFDNPAWTFDVKYDGFRGLCYLEGGRCRLISRNGNLLSRCDELGTQLAAALDVDNAVIDGEVITPDETGRPQFYDLLRANRLRAFVAFDILWLNGLDLRSLPLSQRRATLQSILPTESPIISEALSVTGRGRELFELMCANDLEGIVAKRLQDPYETRIRWLKIKNPNYSQKEGRADLFNRPSPRTALSVA
jgi:bifunctional non-homologous end joining protein LigD